MAEPDFQAGDLSIRYLEDHPDLMSGEVDEAVLRAAAVTAALLEEREREKLRPPHRAEGSPRGFSEWRRAALPTRGRR
jgi:hypothetical protein